MKQFILLLFLISACSPAFSQMFTNEEKEIITLQDLRTLGENQKLLKYLESSNQKIQIRAIYALANIADIKTVEPLGNLLLNSYVKPVKTACAFALSEIDFPGSIDYLKKALAKETDAEVIAAILNALGRVGKADELELLASYSSADNIINSALALAIGRFSARKIRSESAINKLIELSSIDNPIVKKYSAYGFFRTADGNLLTPAREAILGLTEISDPDTRMWAFTALERIHDLNDFNYILNSLKNETDWKVKVNIAGGVYNYKTIYNDKSGGNLLAVLNEQLLDINPNVRLTVLGAIGKYFSDIEFSSSIGDEIKKVLLYYFSDTIKVDWQERGAAVDAYAMIFKDEAKTELFKLFVNTADYDLKPFIIKSFSYFKNPLVYREVQDSISSEVQRYYKKFNIDNKELIGSKDLRQMYRAFIEMITVLDDNLDEENLNITRLIYSEFVSSKDPGLAGMCLEALRDSLYLKYRPETSMLLMYDYKELASYKNFDIILMIIDTWGEFKDTGVVSTLKENLTGGNYEIAIHSAKALEKITGIKYNVSLKPQGDINWARLDAAYTGRFATLRTSIGDIKIKMFPEIAPLTVLNFLKLSEQKLINNTMFPRVVPNFVIQGGDPSESGWGSAGYIIRSEFTDLPYERGSVGMASDGKDTEGSQFFITHSPQPHLEGRYTVFGIVIEGFDVLDNIKYGDSVEEIVLSTE